MGWTENFFEGDWLHVQRNIYPRERSAADAGAIATLLGLKPGDAVLDAPCGTGRISIPLSHLGLQVTGIDITPALLADARRDAPDLEWHEGDMRELPWEGRFDAVVNFWGSFGYFGDEGDETFAAAAFRALKPGGRFLVEGHTIENLAAHFSPKGWMEVEGLKVLEDRTWDPLTGCVEVDWTFVRDGRETTRHSSIRIYSCPELVAMMRRVGFSEVCPYGGLDGSEYGIGKRLALVATKG